MTNNVKMIVNEDGVSAEIMIYAPIGTFFSDDVGAREVVERLNEIKNIHEITVRINSPGGEVFEGLAIYNALLNHPAKISVKIEGIALSIASVIAMAGDNITMSESSLFMIHNPFTIAWGDGAELRKAAAIIDKAKDVLVKAYKRHTTLDNGAIAEAMDAETWYKPDEALAVDFITDVSTAPKIEARFDLDKFNYRNIPSGLHKKMENKVDDDEGLKTEALENIKRLRRKVDLASLSIY